MAGFKEGAIQLKKKDSLSPSDSGSVKVLINSLGQMYTVNEFGVSALIQGGGVSDHKVYATSADQIPGTLLDKIYPGINTYINTLGPTSASYLEIGTLGKVSTSANDIQAYLQNKIVAGSGTILDIINDVTYGKQLRISLDGSGQGAIDWSVLTNKPTASSTTSGVLTSADWNTFNNKQSALTSASNIVIKSVSATSLSGTMYGNVVGNSSTASKLTSAYTINVNGDIIGTATAFDGTSNIIIPTTLPSILTAGIYTKLVVNAKGQVTSGGYLSSSDIPTISWSNISSIPTASSTTSGVLTSTDWNTFNNKQSAITSASSLTFNTISAINFIESGISLSAKYSPYSVYTTVNSNSATWNNKQSALTSASNIVVGNISATNFIESGISLSAKYAPYSVYTTVNSNSATWNNKQNAITTGTSAQYLRDDLSLGTFPTTLAGYGITDAFTQTLADARYPQLSVQYTNPTWLAGIDATTIKTGTIDLARLPALPSANTIVCTTIPTMSASDQLLVAKGTVVIESSTGNTYRYSGTGSVVLTTSYIQQSDLTPDWAVITNKPTNVSTWANDAGYLTNASSLSWSKVTGTPTTLAGYGIADAASSSHTHLWAHITDKPSTFTPSAHAHAIADVTGLQTALDSKTPTTITSYIGQPVDTNTLTFFQTCHTYNTAANRNNKQSALTSASNIVVGNISATNFIESGISLS